MVIFWRTTVSDPKGGRCERDDADMSWLYAEAYESEKEPDGSSEKPSAEPEPEGVTDQESEPEGERSDIEREGDSEPV